ncbi:hypothetical protein L1049_020790 [Liquidambar formosana]|uniref:BTB domain-containing protein n=1 Tax=Liquidambar formosana TaxID=63359 RepID=A0AAP0XAY9_LIQFO
MARQIWRANEARAKVASAIASPLEHVSFGLARYSSKNSSCYVFGAAHANNRLLAHRQDVKMLRWNSGGTELEITTSWRFFIPGHDKATRARKSLDRENATCGSVSCRKSNRCVNFPANVSMVTEALERRNQSWFVRTKVASDFIIQIGDDSFHLHKHPMVFRSGYLNRLVFQRSSNGEKDTSLNIQIDNLPGGSEIFELVVKFCYGWKIDLTSTTIAPLYCAAHFLEMNDDLEQGNFIFKTEAFLSFVLLSSWRDTFHIFKTC